MATNNEKEKANPPAEESTTPVQPTQDQLNAVKLTQNIVNAIQDHSTKISQLIAQDKITKEAFDLLERMIKANDKQLDRLQDQIDRIRKEMK